MRTVSLTKHLTAGSANCIAQGQSLAAAGNVVLNGGSVTAGAFTLDTQRRIIIVSSGDDHLLTAAITAASGTGQRRTETLALTNSGTAVSVNDYLTGGTIALSGATAGTITVGTNGTGSTDWIMPNFHLTPFEVDLNTQVTGSVTYNEETTQDDYFTPAPTMGTVNVWPVLQASTVAAQTTLNTPVRGYRYTITAGTGTLAAQGTQGGISNY